MKSLFLKITLVPVLLISYGCSYQGALAPIEEDPYEGMNRSIYEFNENLDKTVLEPVADSYDFVIPELVQTGVHPYLGGGLCAPKLPKPLTCNIRLSTYRCLCGFVLYVSIVQVACE